VVPLGRGELFGEALARKKFDDFRTDFVRLFDGLEGGVAIEGVGLAADGETADFVFRGDGLGRARREERAEAQGQKRGD